VRALFDNDTDQTVVLAVSLADADATVSRLTWLSLLISGLVLMFTAAAAWAIARIGLQPLGRIEETAQRIAAGDLTERVPTYRRRTEVGRLAHALNGMLVQIERAFSARTDSETRLRRFVSDASHELRTPVAAIRGHAEMWRTGISHDLDTIMSRIESESLRMGDLVDDMLLLARLDQSRPLELEPVDLLSLATDAVIDTQALQPDRAVTIDAHPGANPPVVIGDQARLRQVLANLLTNALAHTPATSPIEVAVRARHRHVEDSVRDAGPGMPPE
jgi:two-component system OmpR family sensor kinase